MKKLHQLCLAGVFTVALTSTAFAGDIATGGRSEPPPPPPASASATTSGETPAAPDFAGDEYQLIRGIALQLLRTMLSVF
ncbi:MAG TPA: hypothetical protein VN844_23100 [Pyrinomonadaceae bacterium]|nr:hypothetical protein [Pyrinomonadaceae bacterium]